MKTRNLLITIGVATLATTTFNATAADTLLSPRAAGNQIKMFAGTNNDPNLVNATGIVALSPRAASNEIKAVAGTSTDVNPALVCTKTMTGSPKAVQACIESGTMSACNPVSVAPLK